MIAPIKIQKPENWQDFEKLCKKLWGEIWDCSSTIKKNGRSGQNQKGVDIYGKPKDVLYYNGIQCKGKDDYTHSKLTKKEVNDEIEKALNFKPSLNEFIFTTTANKDVEIEEYIREINIKHQKEGKFSVDLFSWEDIVDLLEERKETYNWYVNNCQYKNASDISVSFNFNETFEIKPQYVRLIKKYRKINRDIIENPIINAIQQLKKTQTINPFYIQQSSKINYCWCTIPVTVQNIGSTVIENYKLYLTFDPQAIEEIDDKFQYYNPGYLTNLASVMNENIHREKKREVFNSSEYNNVLEFRPINSILVQDEHRTFKIAVKPKNEISEISLEWKLISRDFKKQGNLKIRVNPQLEDKTVWIDVEENKEDEIEIIQKVIEK